MYPPPLTPPRENGDGPDIRREQTSCQASRASSELDANPWLLPLTTALWNGYRARQKGGFLMLSPSPLCRGLRRPVAGLVAFLALVVVLAPLGCRPRSPSGSTGLSGGVTPVVERNKATTKRFFLEVMNEGRFA